MLSVKDKYPDSVVVYINLVLGAGIKYYAFNTTVEDGVLFWKLDT